ncbi:MAG: PDDEXK nuclease domain-containing protein [Candidatus Gastranaerophilaceae bacterium]
MEAVTLDTSYNEILGEIKNKVKQAQFKAMVVINTELISLYWQIGNTILSKQNKQGWGSKVIEKLSNDLSIEFPEMKGFSSRNLKYMRKFAELYPDFEFVQQVVAQIPWNQNVTLMDKIQDEEQRKWYINKSIELGWSRSVLTHQIELDLYDRQAISDKKINNFSQTLPVQQSILANQIMKDPYIFDFLNLGEEKQERDIENALIERIRDFLVELGSGFAFVGQQYHLEVGGEDFYIDLLFYHLKLRCYVVIELKAKEFKPQDVGQLNFYLAVVDDVLRHKDDAPTIGLLLCKSKNKIVAEYTVKNISSALGISEYVITKELSKELQTALPSIEKLEEELKGK